MEKTEEGEEGVAGALKYVISETEFKQQQRRKGESPKQPRRPGQRGEPEGHQGHRQSIRRQARLTGAQTAAHAAPMAGGDVSDAFDDDGLFQFEQGGGGGGAVDATATAPGEDRTDCSRRQ